MKMTQEEINEVHALLLKWFVERDKKAHDIMAFLTSIWIGQMWLNGYDECFVDDTLKRMKSSWSKKRAKESDEGCQ